MPYFPVPLTTGDVPADTRITLINAAGPAPIALLPDQITTRPLNLTPDAGSPVVVFRDSLTGIPHAFDRHIDPDLTPEFQTLSDPHRPGVFLTDSASHSGWSAAGIGVDGDKKFHGAKLTPIPADDDLPYNVLKFWYPTIKLEHLTPEDTAASSEEPQPATTPAKPTRHRRPTRK